ncbi:hypothetical protein AX14_004014 [Amanita brunnescens Koide BX004]|nr:hypothetical protein AX14_004014 [Amanita brunnescens Koide BX004]
MEGITALARGLAKCPNLRHLDLQDNTFTSDGKVSGIAAWTDALTSWPELHTLNLSDCVLSTDGEIPTLVAAIANGSNPAIHTLQLQNNNLDTATFELLATSVSSSLSGLMKLELQWNEIDEDDEYLETIALTLKQRGGKLYAADEEEEEEEEEDQEPEEDVKEEKPVKDETEDDLANLMSKVNLG